MLCRLGPTDNEDKTDSFHEEAKSLPFNQNLNLDNNDYLLLLLNILILDGISQHLKRLLLHRFIGLTFLIHLQHAG